MARTTKVIGFSLPPDIYNQVVDLAKDEGKSKSELFRDMVRVYQEYIEEQRWAKIYKWGAETARRLGIKSEEDLDKFLNEA
ncbi:CopG family transcriptional regulator / antitoxin EndoAI [Candidatus Hakubella thermalkaliphila]|uniref:CopG family transcriptional regulator / antitoxin EndoAI n=1 Tax=Candidatus Hakubella thermalkaliphila TaxID=2754717 RepID=A0A6V8NKE4_9ACTN|nr:ribbon-helix-helix protein, CopG family [Candidatus Hakubella thermalkaliphila]GFP20799.1 CopG family transcriptional regulator / antitoxin EndoAI [Candidatus Hakubella thermalkaliphila]GFP25158.1 hypothetical protein HKBW3S25_00616 [Candidatus Hakubella thermalkaliphila]GFP27584.1 CopG family transcriptional regulator / antitoxin EndoAI [Candidatus Hakubella thermalkaliphila]GFP42694.1 CopG family transcriptional regulator / antitoxin EndoAI [Candidatus Hakubella thermalkaliphila]